MLYIPFNNFCKLSQDSPVFWQQILKLGKIANNIWCYRFMLSAWICAYIPNSKCQFEVAYTNRQTSVHSLSTLVPLLPFSLRSPSASKWLETQSQSRQNFVKSCHVANHPCTCCGTLVGCHLETCPHKTIAEFSGTQPNNIWKRNYSTSIFRYKNMSINYFQECNQ